MRFRSSLACSLFVLAALFTAFRFSRAGHESPDYRVRMEDGAFEIRDSKPRLTSLGGAVALADLALEERALGNLQLQASTRGAVAALKGAASLADAEVTLGGEWSLRGNSFGLGSVTFTGLTLDSLKDVGLLGGPDTDLYVTGWAGSSDFPVTPGAFDTTYSFNRDPFAAKFDAAGGLGMGRRAFGPR